MFWYAINTKPHQERYTEMSLHGIGVETFCPQLKQMKVIRRKKQVRVSPLFPGYIFARFDLNGDYRSVTYARGVRKIVSFGSAPAVVDEKLIEGIRSQIQEGYVMVPTSKFQPGQLVRMQSGPLCGIEAVFERAMPDYQRALLLLRTLAYQARVIVDLREIQIA